MENERESITQNVNNGRTSYFSDLSNDSPQRPLGKPITGRKLSQGLGKVQFQEGRQDRKSTSGDSRYSSQSRLAVVSKRTSHLSRTGEEFYGNKDVTSTGSINYRIDSSSLKVSHDMARWSGFGRLSKMSGKRKSVFGGQQADKTDTFACTYQMKPFVVFSLKKAHSILQVVIDRWLVQIESYNSKRCSHSCMMIGEDVKEKLKCICNSFDDRYRLVVMVTIGEKKSQDVMIGSRCLLNTDTDSFTTYSAANNSLFLTAMACFFYKD